MVVLTVQQRDTIKVVLGLSEWRPSCYKQDIGMDDAGRRRFDCGWREKNRVKPLHEGIVAPVEHNMLAMNVLQVHAPSSSPPVPASWKSTEMTRRVMVLKCWESGSFDSETCHG